MLRLKIIDSLRIFIVKFLYVCVCVCIQCEKVWGYRIVSHFLNHHHHHHHHEAWLSVYVPNCATVLHYFLDDLLVVRVRRSRFSVVFAMLVFLKVNTGPKVMCPCILVLSSATDLVGFKT